MSVPPKVMAAPEALPTVVFTVIGSLNTVLPANVMAEPLLSYSLLVMILPEAV